MTVRKLVLTLCAALAALTATTASPASAKEMEVAMQDDLTLVINAQNRDLALIQFLGMGGTHVRITIEHSREAKDKNKTGLDAGRVTMALMDKAINRVIEFGLTPQITLWWKGEKNPDKVSDWMYNIVDHLGDRVNRYSVLNEPDLYMPLDQPCTATRKEQLIDKFPSMFVREGGDYRAKVKTVGETVPVSRACQRYERGVAYRKVYKPAAKAIRQANRKAQILAGETSAIRGLDYFFLGAKASTLKADGWAHHPFQFSDLHPERPANNWGIGNIKLLKQTVKMPVYMTEFAYPRPNSVMDKRLYGRNLTDQQIASALPRAWSMARRNGARQMLQFQWFRKPIQFDHWDTAINNVDDGTVTPQFLALRQYIASWSK